MARQAGQEGEASLRARSRSAAQRFPLVEAGAGMMRAEREAVKRISVDGDGETGVLRSVSGRLRIPYSRVRTAPVGCRTTRPTHVKRVAGTRSADLPRRAGPAPGAGSGMHSNPLQELEIRLAGPARSRSGTGLAMVWRRGPWTGPGVDDADEAGVRRSGGRTRRGVRWRRRGPRVLAGRGPRARLGPALVGAGVARAVAARQLPLVHDLLQRRGVGRSRRRRCRASTCGSTAGRGTAAASTPSTTRPPTASPSSPLSPRPSASARRPSSARRRSASTASTCACAPATRWSTRAPGS